MAVSHSIDSPAAPEPVAASPACTLNVAKELAALQRMTPKELKLKYAEVFGEASRSNHKVWLVKRIIWRMQANAEGDLSERARRRALELANDADLRMQAPREQKSLPRGQSAVNFQDDKRVPPPGGLIVREYKGQSIQVRVLPNGFEFEGSFHKSLSAVAKAITGTHTNGYLFFRLGEYGGAR